VVITVSRKRVSERGGGAAPGASGDEGCEVDEQGAADSGPRLPKRARTALTEREKLMVLRCFEQCRRELGAGPTVSTAAPRERAAAYTGVGARSVAAVWGEWSKTGRVSDSAPMGNFSQHRSPIDTKDVRAALRRILWRLQTQDEAVSTRRLLDALQSLPDLSDFAASEKALQRLLARMDVRWLKRRGRGLFLQENRRLVAARADFLQRKALNRALPLSERRPWVTIAEAFVVAAAPPSPASGFGVVGPPPPPPPPPPLQQQQQQQQPASAGKPAPASRRGENALPSPASLLAQTPGLASSAAAAAAAALNARRLVVALAVAEMPDGSARLLPGWLVQEADGRVASNEAGMPLSPQAWLDFFRSRVLPNAPPRSVFQVDRPPAAMVREGTSAPLAALTRAEMATWLRERGAQLPSAEVPLRVVLESEIRKRLGVTAARLAESQGHALHFAPRGHAELSDAEEALAQLRLLASRAPAVVAAMTASAPVSVAASSPSFAATASAAPNAGALISGREFEDELAALLRRAESDASDCGAIVAAAARRVRATEASYWADVLALDAAQEERAQRLAAQLAGGEGAGGFDVARLLDESECEGEGEGEGALLTDDDESLR
jgi:hypothetical protein